jgi:ESCRT-I complex subunit VPS28
MDAIKLDQRAVDEIQPLLQDLMEALTRVPALPATFEGTGKMKAWLVTLNKMRAVDEISDEQARQLIYELDTAYAEFHRFLKK